MISCTQKMSYKKRLMKKRTKRMNKRLPQIETNKVS